MAPIIWFLYDFHRIARYNINAQSLSGVRRPDADYKEFRMAGTISSSDVVTFTDKVALSRDAAHRFVSLAARKTNQGENFTVALAGGSTPLLLYTLLSTSTFSDSILWAKVHCFFGDERCVSPSSSDSNYRMAQQTLLSVPELPTA